MVPLTHNLGFPRIGARRELKRATETFWKGKVSETELLAAGAAIRKENWRIQKDAGIALIPSNDFSFYDQMLDMCALFGVVPRRFQWKGETVGLQTYFAMARGAGQSDDCKWHHAPPAAMEMTKWFDTNYHYLVPEWDGGQAFKLASRKPFDEFKEALDLGIRTKPVLIGPVTFVFLGKRLDARVNPLSLLEGLLPFYSDALGELQEMGAEWVQLDEPILATDLAAETQKAFSMAYDFLRQKTPHLKFLLATFFGDLRDNLPVAVRLPVDALHMDLVRAPGQLDAVLQSLGPRMMLSAGVVDGRNIWKNDLHSSLALLEKASAALGVDRLMVAPSCSLLHCPVSLSYETKLDDELKSWLAFGCEKLAETQILALAMGQGRSRVERQLAQNAEDIASRQRSSRIHVHAVKIRSSSVKKEDAQRRSPYPRRAVLQHARFKLPLFPTTTIGSFPQTAEVRNNRARFKKGEISQKEHDEFIRNEMALLVKLQEKLNLDVLVHGEYERNDMVEYFGEQLAGFAFTENGWVQGYGSRCVKPPVIYGDIHRPASMTTRWSVYAQSLTQRPMKGMLTGPVTILQWSFVRDDQPRRETCRQIALAIRDEVLDLEKAGIGIIQIDEPALREGLPLRAAEHPAYLQWAVECFRLSTGGVRDETQIHTHMCYCEFNDILDAIVALDADVISIEASRSKMELLEAFRKFEYPNEIGPGVWDIHSPRVPSAKEMAGLLKKAIRVLPPEHVWVNPDCGLKTRDWKEVLASLKNLVCAAEQMRVAAV
ncbi:MAG: 5-methyltetrahydropteroyltriglutamate--homocysteine S-methyltransferase [Verrucomicrobia bacterium]|nr:5-methyltetrahydropteroyltriglutamate--homocysteine S-methyltransferase [Verrucomicrobiota bacterium]